MPLRQKSLYVAKLSTSQQHKEDKASRIRNPPKVSDAGPGKTQLNQAVYLVLTNDDGMQARVIPPGTTHKEVSSQQSDEGMQS